MTEGNRGTELRTWTPPNNEHQSTWTAAAAPFYINAFEDEMPTSIKQATERNLTGSKNVRIQSLFCSECADQNLSKIVGILILCTVAFHLASQWDSHSFPRLYSYPSLLLYELLFHTQREWGNKFVPSVLLTSAVTGGHYCWLPVKMKSYRWQTSRIRYAVKNRILKCQPSRQCATLLI